MALTLAEANRIIQGALDKAREMNVRISAAVCDSGGRLMAFNRMDGAIWASVYGSQGKAVASAGFARPSGELAERAGSPIIQGIAAAEGGHMIPSQGAVPIIRNGVVEGACGWAGEPPSKTKTAPGRVSPSSEPGRSPGQVRVEENDADPSGAQWSIRRRARAADGQHA